MKNKDKNGKDKCFMIITSTHKVRRDFKDYAKAQGVSMQLAANTLFAAAAQKNFPITIQMKINASKQEGDKWNDE